MKNIINSYLTFRLGDESFALSVKHVINILEMCRITKVPKMPDYMKGVINLRGEVLSVLDTRLKFAMSETELTARTCILVLEVGDIDKPIKLGILVDQVDEVLEIAENTIKPPPSIGSKYENEFIIGMIEHQDKFTMLLDINNVFTNDEIFNLHEINEEMAVED